jgi:hypothetical protein
MMNNWFNTIMDNGFNLFLPILYVLLTVGAGVYLSWMAIQRQKNMAMMSNNIKNKLKNNVCLSPKNIVHIGRGYNLSAKKSRDVIYNIYANIDDPASHTALDSLVSDIEKVELFDDLPDEVKPSMSRIAKLIDNSTEISDKQILTPIATKLNEYVELKAEQEKMKKQTNRAYFITMISFVVGAISFYFTLNSPSDGDIKRTIEQVFSERLANDPTAPPPARLSTEKQLKPN